MSSTTTIRLSDELKARLAEAARRGGTTAHGFILEAIAEKIEQDERRSAFAEEAQTRLSRLVQSGRSIAWDDMKRYLGARIAGDKVAPPAARKLAR
ncbi:MAG: ribbon-helix-helix protein, CopG family [Proteobacteria bacterium]|nr:ribbon-helix-helix protein, CopG family [Pseudomonadota bacterium]